MANPGFLSKRVKRKSQTGITSDRYEFLGLDQAEPDLGDPLVGVSSVGANPYTGSNANLYFVASDGNGKRYWAKQTDIISGGVVTPGAITVRNNGSIVGDASLVKDVNFTGTGVTVNINPSIGSSGVNVQITVSDVAISGGSTGSIGFKGSNGLLQVASDLIYNPTNLRVGIGSTIPTEKLDVLGNAKVSGTVNAGIITANSGFFTNTLKVGNFEISDTTTFFRVSSGSVGIGTTLPRSTLDVIGNAIITGVATIGVITATSGFVGVLTSTSFNAGFITATRAFIGILTSPTINNTTFISTNFTATNILGTAATFTSASVTNNFQVNGSTLFVNALADSVGIGTTNPTQRLQIGTGTSAIVATNTGRVGIGTTNPSYLLDVRGNVGFSSFIFVGGLSGSANEVLVSGGTGLPFWGAPGGITVGSANSVGVADTQASGLFYPTFTQQTQNNAFIRVDTNGLVYNPALNNLGIGSGITTSNLSYNLTVNGSVGVNTNALFVSSTNNRVGIGTTIPNFTLDVSGTVNASTSVSAGTTVIIGTSPVANLSSGIVTTTTTSTATVSSLNTSLFRSARYNVQITCTGQLVGSASSSSAVSVGSLQGGTNYASGSYTNVVLATTSGTGNDASANISVTPEQTITIDSISNGLFNTSNDTTAIKINAPVLFNRAIPATAAQNSRVTLITLTNPGSGYTSVPVIGIATPTNNPAIAGVTGIGSTATAVVSSMIVSNVAITTAGIHTTVPTISFNSPVGVGTSARGIVGFGVSTVEVTSTGFGYNPLPSVSISGNLLPTIGVAGTVSISTVFATNIIITNTGLGYTSGNFPVLTFSSPTIGVNTATAVVTSLGISTQFTIISGIGYTRSPLLTVSSPAVGLNTATINCTLGISSFTVVNSGSGYTSSSQITLSPSPTVTGFAATVGMGVSSTGLTESGGGSYTSFPTVTFSSPNVGLNTATGQFANRIGGVLSGFTITNSGSGYFSIPTVTITGGGGSGAGVTITTMIVTDVTVNNTGFGVTSVPTVSLVSPVGSGASISARMGIGQVNVVGFGSGYNVNPSIAVTASDGITGAGASVIAGLGITSSNIVITNPGTGYSSIPLLTISSPVGVASTAVGLVGVGISAIRVDSPGIGYTSSLPTISFSTFIDNLGAGATASATSIIVTNVFIVNPGAGYTETDLASPTIATFNPVGTSNTVGFAVSTITITNTGIGYTTAASAAISFSPAPRVGVETSAVAIASASLGYPGILPGPGVSTTGSTQIYFVASKTSTTLGISTGVGIGTFTSTTVGDDVFASNNPLVSIGGSVTSVFVTSPGSGYTPASRLTAVNFDGANVGSGFTFTSSTVVNNYQFTDVMILQTVGSANTACDYIEYASLANEDILGSFSSDISGSVARLLITPTYRNNTIKVSSHSITT